MKKNLGKFLACGLLAVGLALPVMAKADGVSLNVNLGADDAAHFHFDKRGHHHPLIWKAAMQLRNAKHTLWAAADDFGGHKVAAIMAINRALDELAVADEFAHSRGH
jgi:hypothetical protein